MKPRNVFSGRTACVRGLLVLAALLTGLGAAWAQPYAIDWHTIDGGGGTSSGGAFTLSGTIGQPDAGVMSGGSYTLKGGFWSIAAIQNPVAPLLSVTLSATNTVVISWPASETQWTLNWTANLGANPISWTPILPPYTTSGSDVVYVEAVPTGNRYYRLSN